MMDRSCRVLAIAGVVLGATALTGCAASRDPDRAPAGGDASGTADPVREAPPRVAPILLFTGEGTSPGDVAAVEAILHRSRLAYATASTSQLNGMSESRLRAHRLLIVPGGNFVRIGNGLSASATATIRDAVRDGLNYLGLCAGAFFAGDSPYNGLNLTAGTRFGFYAAEARGFRKAAVAVTAPGGQTLEQYWEDGPQLAGWGAVVGRYPDGSPAIVEGTFGEGWVILTGVHPEAPASWRRGLDFRTPADAANAYAATLIRAALEGERLPHY
jgi:glutamine amidotransferase-like uncharacterized protein